MHQAQKKHYSKRSCLKNSKNLQKQLTLHHIHSHSYVLNLFILQFFNRSRSYYIEIANALV